MSVPYPVKIALALRSGNRCAMPSCRRLLSAEPRDDESVMLGVAAHIAGERGGGTRGRPSARFDPTMSPEQRNSLANLLYVCQNCHAKIDTQPHGEREYPVERLLEIKSEHEKTVAAAMDEALATVTFVELAEATRWVGEVPPPPPGRDFSLVAIEDKIATNGLSLSSRNLIVAHLAVAPQVRSFIQELSRDDPGFPQRLISGFLQHYHKLRAQGLPRPRATRVRRRARALDRLPGPRQRNVRRSRFATAGGGDPAGCGGGRRHGDAVPLRAQFGHGAL